MANQRFVDAVAQLERVTAEKPDLAQPFLTLGALHLEMRQPRPAEAALQRYLDLSGGQRRASACQRRGRRR
jgi:hypothetical protein